MFAILGGGMAMAGTLDVMPTEQEPFTVKFAETHRKYLEERAVYITENADRLNLPQKTRDSAQIAKDNFEDHLIEKKYINTKGEKIEKPKQTVIEAIGEELGQIQLINKAYAFVFGKEDFESCGSNPCSFDGDNSYGSGAMNLDSTSKVNGVDSARCDVGAINSGCVWYKDIASAGEYWYQITLFLPTGWAIGAASYLSLLNTGDGVGAPVYCNLEDYGTVRITCSGDELSYTDTGINVSLNTKTKLEFRIKIGAATGDLDIWKDNNVQGSPDYNGSGTLNTGTQNITYVDIGGYNPDIVNDRFYDDVIVNTSFIGDGVESSTSNIKSTLKGSVTVKGGVIIR